MRPSLVPRIDDWVLNILTKSPKRFLLLLYDATGELSLNGQVITDTFNCFRKNNGTWSYRLFYFQPAGQLMNECVSCHRENVDGFIFQDTLTSFICISCIRRN